MRCDEKPGPVKCGRDARLEQGNLGWGDGNPVWQNWEVVVREVPWVIICKKEIICVELCVCVLSHSVVSSSLQTIAHQAPLSMRFFRQEYCTSYSRGHSRPKDGTRVSCVSCIGRQIFTSAICILANPIYSQIQVREWLKVETSWICKLGDNYMHNTVVIFHTERFVIGLLIKAKIATKGKVQ